MTIQKYKVGPGTLKLNAARTATVSTTTSSTTITTTGATFTSGDVGASITGTGIPGGATITAVASATSATLSAAATATGTPTATITPTGGVQDFSCQIKSATVEWSDDTDDNTPVLCGEEVEGDITWSASISGTLLQDIATLVPWTWTNKGKKVPFEYIPNTVAAKKVVGVLVVKPLSVGGEVKTTAESDFEWPCVGEPALV